MTPLTRSILGALSFMLFSTIGVAAQEQDRLIEKQSNLNEPVKITVVKTKRGQIVPGKKFSDDNDWFKGLTVSVTNNSGKTVNYIGIRLTFPRPEDDGTANEPPFVDSLEYGISPFVDKGSLPPSLTPPRAINLGETIALTLSDHWFDRYKRALTKIKYPTSIKRIEILVEEVGFSDDTVWTLGVRYRRDPSNPGEWIKIEEP